MPSSKKKYYNLELSVKNGLHFFKDASWEKLSFKTKQALLVIQPFAFYCFNNEPLILFFHNCSDKKLAQRLCWNFNKAPVVIFFDGDENPISDDGNEICISVKSKIEIKNAFDLDTSTGELNDFPEDDIKQFSYWNIVSGKIWETYADSFKNENRVDYKLLENIGAVRDIFIKSKLEKDRKEAAIIINRVLGRLIFLRYLADRNVKVNFEKWDYITKESLTDIIPDRDCLYRLFKHLKYKFNGDLFPFVQKDEDDLKDSYLYEQSKLENTDLKLISYLFEGAKVLGKNIQPSLFHLYDFSVIPIELVSNIYEYFMGDKKQDDNKAFYTPPFLADYLINETIEPYLEKQDKWRHCRTLDPACGSGVFLVETLRRIILKYKSLNPDISTKKFKKILCDILSHNIFGIDKDRDAIDVSIFSLYITLLDFVDEPKDVEDFRFPPLLHSNFFIADFFEAVDKSKQNDIIEKFEQVKLDFIIGNPPWGKVENSPYVQYAKERLEEEPEELKRLQKLFPKNHRGQNRKIKLVANNEIAQGFLLRTFDFVDEDKTTCALLVTSKVLHNLQSNVFRNYLLNKTKVEKVVDFSAIRKDLFSLKPKGAKKTIGPCAFLIYKWTDSNISQNIIHHYSPKNNRIFKVFKILNIQKFDYKKIRQQQFIDFDWAWKVFLYGNLLDLKFVKFLKENFKTVTELTDSDDFVSGRGVEPYGKDDNTAHLQDVVLIDTDKDLERYHVSMKPTTIWWVGRKEKRKIWDRKTAHRPKEKLFKAGLFSGNSLLISKGINPDFQAVATFIEKKGVFRDSITGIKAKTSSVIGLIKSFVGLLNSKLFSYYIFSVGSSTGVEREQVQDVEKFSFPVAPNSKIADLVDEISDAKGKLHQLKSTNKGAFTPKLEQQKNELEGKVKDLERQIERVINKTYNFTKQEKALINFSQTVSIPLFKGDKTPFEKVSKSQMNKYIKVFENYFTQIFDKPDKYFQVDVFESDFIIGVKFNVVKNKPQTIISYQKDKDQMAIMKMFFAAFGSEQITDRIFIQKDVKVIDKHSFWVIKPNEFKCWHEAVAHLDLDEFIPKLIVSDKTALAHA